MTAQKGKTMESTQKISLYIGLEADGTYTVVRLHGYSREPLAKTVSLDQAEDLLERLQEGQTMLEALAAMSGFAIPNGA